MTENDRDELGTPLPDAARLPRSIEPPRDLWPGIAARLGSRRPAWRPLLWGVPLAVAALLALILARPPRFTVTTLAGRPLVENGAVTTDDSSRAHIALSIGELDVQPGTRLHVVAVNRHEQRFALERGAISAVVNAPPRVFVIETPSAVATDLGCAYTVRVDAAGNGLLHVTAGIVELGAPGRVVFVPLGALAPLYAGHGPGVPYVDDAAPALSEGLAGLDAAPGDSASLAVALAAARPEDGLSLWHLLSWVGPSQRGAVFDRLARLVPPPTGVTRDGILGLDHRMLDDWWKYLPRTVWRSGM